MEVTWFIPNSTFGLQLKHLTINEMELITQILTNKKSWTMKVILEISFEITNNKLMFINFIINHIWFTMPS
jgi:hypothetical protein